jgi:hypothetical protein
VPYDIAAHPVTAAFTEAGAPAVLAGREELAASISSVDGEEGALMDAATRNAVQRVNALTRETDEAAAARRLIRTAGLDAVTEALARYRDGGSLTCDEAAWLAVSLKNLPVRDDAWSRMDPGHRHVHLRLWTDLTRLARPGYVAAPATLLAFTAWQCGNGALSNVALDRAQADDPHYSMAMLLREVFIQGAVTPEAARPPMTPEDVAASYAVDIASGR